MAAMLSVQLGLTEGYFEWSLLQEHWHQISWAILAVGVSLALVIALYARRIVDYSREVDAQITRADSERLQAHQQLEQQFAERRQAEEKASGAVRRLQDAINSIADGFAVWDAEDRLVAWNNKFAHFFSAHVSLLKVGTPFSDFRRAGWRKRAPMGFAEAEISRRMKLHRKGGAAEAFEVQDGLWLEISEHFTEEGATVSVYRDISKGRRAEEEARKTNRMLETILETSPLPIMTVDAGGIVRIWNPAAEKLFGWTAEEVIGEQVPFRKHDINSDKGELQNRIFTEKRRISLETTRLAKDGTPLDIEVHATPTFNENNEINGFTAVVVDIRGHKSAERRLTDALKTLQAVISACPLPTYAMNREGGIEIWNPAAQRIFGWTSEEVLGNRVPFIPPEHAEETDRIRQTLLRERSLLINEVSRQKKNGELVDLKAYVAPVFDENGEIASYVAIAVDITEAKQDEQALLDAKEAAEIANESKSQFLANMSHELRTPLNAIIGFSDIMGKELFGALGNDHYSEYAQDIHNSGRHLLDIINDILDLAKVEAGKLVLDEEAFDLSKSINSAVRLVRESADNGEVRIHQDIAPDLPYLRADERKIKQVLLNLLSNAVKFTEPGGTVTILAETAHAGAFKIVVSDTGIGMKQEDIDIALSVFGQVDGSLQRKYEGTGLGLPLSRSLVEMHNGSLDVKSESGIGTTVTVLLPRERIYPDSLLKSGL